MFLCTLIIFKTCRLMHSSLSTLFRVDNFVNWLVFFIPRICLWRKTNCFPPFLRFRILILLLVFYFFRFFFKQLFIFLMVIFQNYTYIGLTGQWRKNRALLFVMDFPCLNINQKTMKFELTFLSVFLPFRKHFFG